MFTLDITASRSGKVQSFILTDAATLADAEAVAVSPLFDTLAGHVVVNSWSVEAWFFRRPLGVARPSTADQEAFAVGEPSNLTPASKAGSIARSAAPPPPLPPPLYTRLPSYTWVPRTIG